MATVSCHNGHNCHVIDVSMAGLMYLSEARHESNLWNHSQVNSFMYGNREI